MPFGSPEIELYLCIVLSGFGRQSYVRIKLLRLNVQFPQYSEREIAFEQLALVNGTCVRFEEKGN